MHHHKTVIILVIFIEDGSPGKNIWYDYTLRASEVKALAVMEAPIPGFYPPVRPPLWWVVFRYNGILPAGAKPEIVNSVTTSFFTSIGYADA